MNREEIELLFSEALKTKLLGTQSAQGRKILDVRVFISVYTISGEEYEYGHDLDELEIEVKTSSPGSRTKKWTRYYF